LQQSQQRPKLTDRAKSAWSYAWSYVPHSTSEYVDSLSPLGGLA
jgi:hypothetical protein